MRSKTQDTSPLPESDETQYEKVTSDMADNARHEPTAVVQEPANQLSESAENTCETIEPLSSNMDRTLQTMIEKFADCGGYLLILLGHLSQTSMLKAGGYGSIALTTAIIAVHSFRKYRRVNRFDK